MGFLVLRKVYGGLGHFQNGCWKEGETWKYRLGEKCQCLGLMPASLLPLPLPLPLCSSVQEQQAHPHHHPEPTCPRDRGGCSLHRLHPPHPVHWWAGSASHQPVRGDPGLAPPGWQVAQRPLSLLRSPCCTTAVSSATGAPVGGGMGTGTDGVRGGRSWEVALGEERGYRPSQRSGKGWTVWFNKLCLILDRLGSKLGGLAQVTSLP